MPLPSTIERGLEKRCHSPGRNLKSMTRQSIGLPDYVTHYHLAKKAPFLNLSDLTTRELAVVMRDLEERRANSRLERVFGRRYMELRRNPPHLEVSDRGTIEGTGSCTRS
jgi:hypothetical protein